MLFGLCGLKRPLMHSSNAALVKIFEEKFGAKLKVPKHLEEASFGVALFGLISCGVFKNAEEAQKIIRYN